MSEILSGDVITKENMRRVTITQSDRGGISFEVKLKPIVRMLIDDGYIEQYHEHYANFFLELRHAWLKQSNYKPNPIYFDLLELSTSPQSGTEIYSALRHEIGIQKAGDTANIVDYAMNQHKSYLQATEANLMRIEFERVASAIENYLKKSKEPVAQ